MAPVKPMSTDRNTKTKPGATGFHQDYNQEPPPTQDLNPDAVTEDSVLPAPRKLAPVKVAPAKRGARKSR